MARNKKAAAVRGPPAQVVAAGVMASGSAAPQFAPAAANGAGAGAAPAATSADKGKGKAREPPADAQQTRKNALVTPLQTLHEAPTALGSSPVPVEMDELAFCEWSAIVDLHAMWRALDAAQKSKKTSPSLPNERAAAEATGGSMSHAMEAAPRQGKRSLFLPAEEELRSTPAKRLKREQSASPAASAEQPRAPLPWFSTTLSFRLEPTQAHMSPGECEQLRDSLSLGDVSMEPAPVSDEGSDTAGTPVVVQQYHLLTAQGSAIATIPLIDLPSASIERGRHSWTNGPWLPAALRLRESHIELRTELHLRFSSPSSTPGELLLELRVSVALLPAAFEPALEAAARDLNALVRFASPSAAREDARHRCGQQLSERFVYASLHASTLPAAAGLQPAQLEPTLMPFQRRSVNFLLGREGVQLAQPDAPAPEEGRSALVPTTGIMGSHGEMETGLWWESVASASAPLYFNAFAGMFTQDADVARFNVRGGVLAEEMGLGKTVEIFALILLHPCPPSVIDNPVSFYSETLQLNVTHARTTLIVCPELLRQQWIDEAQTHAPDLTVFNYVNHLQAAKAVPKGTTWIEWAKSFHVIVASYETLKTELRVAKPERERERRQPRRYERPRSLLVQLAYHRVVMDEVQLVGNSMAAETVSMIERTSSIAVSGTPVTRLDDLRSLFRFLRVLGPYDTAAAFKRLLTPELAPTLERVLGMLATRNTKAQVRSETTLPQQTRYLLPVELGPVQRTFYEELWTTALSDLQISGHGNSVGLVYDAKGTMAQNSDGSLRHAQPDINKLRAHLSLLRQACTHPQVTDRSVAARAGRGIATNTIQSMQDVLDRMREDAVAARDSHFLSLKTKEVSAALLLIQSPKPRAEAVYEEAKDELLALRAGLEVRIGDIRQALAVAHKSGPLYRFTSVEAAAAEGDDDLLRDSDGTDGRQIDGEQALQRRDKLRARAAHTGAISMRLRLHLEQLHRVYSWLGNVYFRMGERDLAAAAAAQPPAVEGAPAPVSPHKALEDEAYAAAESVRQELLKESLDDVERGAAPVKAAAAPALAVEQHFGNGGIMSFIEFTSLQTLAARLDANAAVVIAWRKRIIDHLLRPVNREVDLNDENDDQYAEALEAQSEAETLLEMYRVLLAEREAIVSGALATGATSKPNLFVQLERQVNEQKRLRLLVGDNKNSEFKDDLLDVEQLQTLQTQLKLFRALNKERQQVSLGSERPVVAIVQALRDVIARCDRNEEMAIARRGLNDARDMQRAAQNNLEKLRREQLVLARLFNARSTYFRRLQGISDTSRDEVVRKSYEIDRAILKREAEQMRQELGRLESRSRYLTNMDAAPEIMCTICYEDKEIQCLLDCAHRFCVPCALKTLEPPTNGKCYMCQQVTPRGRHLTRVAVTEAAAAAARAANEEARRASKSATTDLYAAAPLEAKPLYNLLEREEREDIEGVRLSTRYGAKLQLLVQHVLHIAQTQSATKLIIFSSFSRGLDLVSQALRAQALRHVRVDTGGRVAARQVDAFRNSRDTNVLLLHSEAQSAGLNLTCASVVILLEPFVNHAVELQAIGRVHRIGQTQATSVFCYSAIDTVEERICSAQVARGTSLYVLANARSAEMPDADGRAAAPATTSGPRSKKGPPGEHVNSVRELLACFFPEKQPTYRASAAASARDFDSHQRLMLAAGATAAGSSSDADSRRRLALAAAERRRMDTA